jgi:hypothetical protein
MIGKESPQTMDEKISSWHCSFSQTSTNSSTHSTSHDSSIPPQNNTTPTINERIPHLVSLPRNHGHPKPHSLPSSKFPYRVSPRLRLPHTFSIILFTTFLFFSTCRAEYYIEERMLELPKEVPELFQSTLARLARSGSILVDQRPYFNPDHAIASRTKNPSSVDSPSDIIITADNLHRRTDAAAETNDEVSSVSNAITSTATIVPPKSTGTGTSSGTSTLAGSTTSSGLAVAATASASALPQPFDSGFSSNITSTCSSFVTGFLANETFKSCLPFSLLLQVSSPFAAHPIITQLRLISIV